MIKAVILTTLLIGSVGAFAQQIVPLVRDNAMLTHVSIPFMLKDQSGKPLTILSFDVEKSNCMGMIDPFIPSNLLVKCSTKTDLSFHVFYAKDGSTFKINYGPIQIDKLTEEEILQPVSGPSDEHADGKKLFMASCTGCHHQVPSDLKGRSIATIVSNINAVPSMTRDPRVRKLTADEIKKISDFLSSL